MISPGNRPCITPIPWTRSLPGAGRRFSVTEPFIARSGRVAYGKFFDRKAGFISEEWLPYFVNYRRDGYDFDALWEDGKASARQKKIMDLFAEEFEDEEYFSNELKQKSGFGKNGDKGFEGIITGLQMQIYLCVRDFRQRMLNDTNVLKESVPD